MNIKSLLAGCFAKIEEHNTRVISVYLPNPFYDDLSEEDDFKVEDGIHYFWGSEILEWGFKSPILLVGNDLSGMFKVSEENIVDYKVSYVKKDEIVVDSGSFEVKEKGNPINNEVKTKVLRLLKECDELIQNNKVEDVKNQLVEKLEEVKSFYGCKK